MAKLSDVLGNGVYPGTSARIVTVDDDAQTAHVAMSFQTEIRVRRHDDKIEASTTTYGRSTLHLWLASELVLLTAVFVSVVVLGGTAAGRVLTPFFGVCATLVFFQGKAILLVRGRIVATAQLHWIQNGIE